MGCVFARTEADGAASCRCATHPERVGHPPPAEIDPGVLGAMLGPLRDKHAFGSPLV